MTKRINVIFFLAVLFFITKIISVILTNFDLFGDEAQYWLWSKNPDFGYYSKPPMLSWIIAAWCSAFGDSFFTIKTIPIFFYFFTSIVVFQISMKLVKDSELALLTSLAFFLMPGISVSSFLVSTDVVLIFFWCLSLLMLLTIKDRPTNLNYVLLGIFLGMAFLSKYAAIYFIISMFFLFLDKKMRIIFFKNNWGFLWSLVVLLIIVAPNLFWNFNHGWPTFKHTSDNASLNSINLNIFGGLTFLLSQIFMVGPIIVIFFIFYFFKVSWLSFNSRFLLFFSLPILIIVLIESLLVRANANWAAVSLVSLIIFFVHTLYSLNKSVFFINSFLNIVFGFALFILISFSSPLSLFDRISGIKEFSETLRYDTLFEDRILVVSDRMIFSNLSYLYYKDKIKIYVPHNNKLKPSHHFQMTNSLPENFNKNFIFIGHLGHLDYLKNEYTIKKLYKKSVKFKLDDINVYEVIF